MNTVTVRYLGYFHETGCFTCAVFNGSINENSGICVEEPTEAKLKVKVEDTLKNISKGKKLSMISQNKGTREITFKF